MQVGLKRIDAAVDALRPLGFSKDIVHKTVNALLKVISSSFLQISISLCVLHFVYRNDGVFVLQVYDGNWVFIEEGSYKLLIETILEEQEKTGGITVVIYLC